MYFEMALFFINKFYKNIGIIFTQNLKPITTIISFEGGN